MLGLITPEDDSDDGIVLGGRGVVTMRNTKRIFTSSRGITQVKEGYKVVVTLPPVEGQEEASKTQTVLGIYATNVEAALAHDLEIRRLWPEEISEKMVNLDPVNTQRLSLLSATTPSLIDLWPEDEKLQLKDVSILKKHLKMGGHPARCVLPLHENQYQYPTTLPLFASSGFAKR